MNRMKLPGFTAEEALLPTSGRYRGSLSRVVATVGVVPAQSALFARSPGFRSPCIEWCKDCKDCDWYCCKVSTESVFSPGGGTFIG